MNCIRCGRIVPDGVTFCDECLGITSAPLEESEYLNTRVVLPQKKAVPAVKKDSKSSKKSGKTHTYVKTQQKDAVAKAKPRGGLIAAVVILSLVSVACLTALAFGAKYVMSNSFTRTQNQLRSAQEANERLEHQIEDLTKKTQELEASRSQLAIDNVAKDQEILSLKEAMNGYEQQGSETDFAFRELEDKNQALTQKVTDLTDQNKAYAEQVGSLQSSLSSQESRISELEDKISTMESETASLKKKSNFVDAHVVFVENDGTNYYHKYSCSRFKQNSYWAYSTSLAEARGYTPCPYCH